MSGSGLSLCLLLGRLQELGFPCGRRRVRLRPMRPRLPIGTSDFLQLRRDGLHYVDKSGFVVDVLRSTARVLLVPRPRRFGKTLNITTLAAFVGRTDEDRTDVFSDLEVWRAGDDVRAHFGRYPVIFLTFKDVKANEWPDCRARIAGLVAAECRRVEAVIAPVLSPAESSLFRQLRDATADNATLWEALVLLSEWLHRATGERAVVLVDEYDTPIHAGFHHGYYDQVIELFRNLFSGAFKDNAHLEKGVLTGILRVAKESIFSGLNNLAVYTLLEPEMSQYFGFTADEVKALAIASEAEDKLGEIEQWYNGYVFGGETVIYNPWSVVSYLMSQARIPRGYWAQTSSDDILRELLIQRGLVSQADLETLLEGGAVTKVIDEHIVLRDVRENPDAVWSFLLFSGYLKPISARPAEDQWEVELAVPNREVRGVLDRMFRTFLVEGLHGSGRVQDLCAALLKADAKTFGRLLGELMLATISYHDLAVRQPEAVYQAFVLGLLVTLERTHEVTSNREAGYGRYDVLVAPRQAGGTGTVLELKVIETDEGETVETALESALSQLRERDYASALRERGAGTVYQLAAVFDGKRAFARAL